MNVLEKILEEIEEMRDIMKSTVATDCFGKECENEDCTVCVYVKEQWKWSVLTWMRLRICLEKD